MPYERLWCLTVIAFAAFSAQLIARAQSVEERAATPKDQAAETVDFLILAVKPEGDKDYTLVQVGDSKIDVSRLTAMAPKTSGGLLGQLGIGVRDYDEAAEAAECRAACKANTRCHDFAYSRPTENQPLGVCRLKAIVETSFGVMAPVKDAGDLAVDSPLSDAATATPAPTASRIIFDGKEPKGGATYGADAKPTPVTLKFAAPIASLNVVIRAAETTGQRTWAGVEALDAAGKLVERTGAWIPAGGEVNIGQAIALNGETDRIATVKIDAREPRALLLDRVEFTRTLTAAPPVVAETPAATPVQVQEPAPPPREEVPPPPELPPFVAEHFPLPPRAVATEPPVDITIPPPAPEGEPVAIEPEEPPAIEPPVPATPVAEPARPRRERGLPLWLALGAVALMFAGAGVYWRNHRARMLTRLTTRLVTNGRDAAKITIDGVEGADLSLRFVVRAPVTVNVPVANSDFSSKGVPA